MGINNAIIVKLHNPELLNTTNVRNLKVIKTLVIMVSLSAIE